MTTDELIRDINKFATIIDDLSKLNAYHYPHQELSSPLREAIDIISDQTDLLYKELGRTMYTDKTGRKQ